MDRQQRLAALTLLSAMVLAACGGGGSDSSSTTPPPPPPSGPTDAERSAAASSTVANNPKCSQATLGDYYWEIGDANGVKASGSVGGGVGATTSLWVFSSSKWLYAANVVEKHGVRDQDVPYLNFTSGYTNFGNIPVCTGSTVADCLLPAKYEKDAATAGRFDYDSGHMQVHAETLMGLGSADNAALAADLEDTLGLTGFSYNVPQPAAGVQTTPATYAQFLRRLLNGDLALGAALGSHKTCVQPGASGCNAAYAPDSIGSEAWSYSLGHWVEDDPSVGDHAFSSGGGGGFYPWIDSSKTYYGIVARETETESAAGYHSAECGRLVRQAWMTGKPATSTVPTPGR